MELAEVRNAYIHVKLFPTGYLEGHAPGPAEEYQRRLHGTARETDNGGIDDDAGRDFVVAAV